MAVYGKMVLTTQGLALYSKAQTGTLLNFTRMQIGSGQLAAGQDPATLTALITPIAFFSINSVSSSGNMAYVKGIFENTNINASTYSCELGLFATDPVAGEILYAYANAGNQGDTIPPISAGPLSKQYQINVAIGNATSITATIPAGTYIPITDKGAASGVAPLDASSLLPSANLPKASATALGGVKVGNNLSVAVDGTLSGAAPYSLPVASASALGGVKVGSGINVAGDGTISSQTVPVASAAAAGTVQVAASPTSGSPVAASRVGSASEVLVTGTAAQTILSFTPTAAGNYLIWVYLRVVTAATVITLQTSYNDATGAQINTQLNAQSQPVGSYSLVPLFINAASGTPIAVKVTAGIANQVYVSANIEGV